MNYEWFGDFLFVEAASAGVREVCVGEVYHRHTGAWAWLLYSDPPGGKFPDEELGEAATRDAAMDALKAADRLRRDGPGQPATEVRDSAVSQSGAVRPDGGVAAQPSSVEPGASPLAEGVGHRRPVEGDRQPGPAGAPPAPAAQPLPATSGGDSAPASVPPTDPSRASARSPEVVGSGALEAGWVALGAWRACSSPGCVLRVGHDGEHRKWAEPYPTTRLDPPRLRGADPALWYYLDDPGTLTEATSPGLGPADVVPPLQPAPSGGEGDCWQELIDSLPSNHALRPACEARRLLGIERYGQPLRRGDGRSAVQDLRDELLDASVYAWRLGYEDLALELIDTATTLESKAAREEGE